MSLVSRSYTLLSTNTSSQGWFSKRKLWSIFHAFTSNSWPYKCANNESWLYPACIHSLLQDRHPVLTWTKSHLQLPVLWLPSGLCHRLRPGEVSDMPCTGKQQAAQEAALLALGSFLLRSTQRRQQRTRHTPDNYSRLQRRGEARGGCGDQWGRVKFRDLTSNL